MVNAAALLAMTSPVYVLSTLEVEQLTSAIEAAATNGALLSVLGVPFLTGSVETRKIDAVNVFLASYVTPEGTPWAGPPLVMLKTVGAATTWQLDLTNHPNLKNWWKAIEAQVEAALLSAAARGEHTLLVSTLADEDRTYKRGVPTDWNPKRFPAVTVDINVSKGVYQIPAITACMNDGKAELTALGYGAVVRTQGTTAINTLEVTW